MRIVVPIDVHEISCTYAVLEGATVSQKPRKIRNDETSLRSLARSFPTAEFVVEACGLHEVLVDVLRSEGVKVFAVKAPKQDPGSKSDSKDTLRIGRKFLAGDLSIVFVPTPDVRRLRDVVNQRRYVVQDRTATLNHIRSSIVRWKFPFTDVQADRARIIEAFPHLESSYELLDVFDRSIKSLTTNVVRMSRDYPTIQRLQSIPGFGDIVAPAFFARVGDIRRFPDGHALVTYLGMNPKWSQSGERAKDLHRITKTGDAYLRGLLTQAAWVHVARADSDITSAYTRLVDERGKGSMVAIGGVARKLVLAAHRVWSEDRDFTLTRPTNRFVSCRARA